MFEKIIQVLVDNGKGIHGYRKCAEAAYGSIADAPELASAYYLLASEAESFIDFNERMPMNITDTENAFEQFMANAKQLGEAFSSGTAEQKLAAINAVATRLVEKL